MMMPASFLALDEVIPRKVPPLRFIHSLEHIVNAFRYKIIDPLSCGPQAVTIHTPLKRG
jgi:hypothetical protein